MTTIAPNSTPTEPQAKPKVLRRPAQFSRRADAVDETAPLPASIVPNSPAPHAAQSRMTMPMARSWQEDGRFGVFAIGCVVLFNLFLALVLPHIAPEESATGPSTAILMNNAAMPSAMKQAHEANVTVYSEPDQDADDSGRMDLDALPEEHNDFSVSPKDIPPPTARALDE